MSVHVNVSIHLDIDVAFTIDQSPAGSYIIKLLDKYGMPAAMVFTSKHDLARLGDEIKKVLG